MDPTQFEKIAKRVGAATSRRAVVLAVLAGVPVALGLRPAPVEAGIPIVHCKPPGKRCSSDKKCCTGNCRKGICTCAKKGQACWAPLEGALCCSRRCSSGKCA